MRGRTRLNRLNAVAWDMRTGMKVKASTIVEDGERPGLWVSRENADEQHPQRFVRPPGPDGDFWRPGAPALDYFMYVDVVTKMPWDNPNYDQFPKMTLEFSRSHLFTDLGSTTDNVTTAAGLTLGTRTFSSGILEIITVNDFTSGSGSAPHMNSSAPTFGNGIREVITVNDFLSGASAAPGMVTTAPTFASGIKEVITVNDFVTAPAAALSLKPPATGTNGVQDKINYSRWGVGGWDTGPWGSNIITTGY